MDAQPTILKGPLPGQAVDEHLKRFGKLPGEEGNCSSCGLLRALNEGTCAMCAERASKTLVLTEEEMADTAAAAVAAATPAPAAPAAAPTGEAAVTVVAEMSIKLLSNGDATISGPLDNRAVILNMLNAAHDLSYEFEQRLQKEMRAKAALAGKPAPKKWSKAWWAEQFAQRRAEKEAREAEQRNKELARRDAEAANRG